MKRSSLRIQTKQKRGERDTARMGNLVQTPEKPKQLVFFFCCTGRNAVQRVGGSSRLPNFRVMTSYSLSPCPVADVGSAAWCRSRYLPKPEVCQGHEPPATQREGRALGRDPGCTSSAAVALPLSAIPNCFAMAVPSLA